jgi:hypothetical protein
MEPPVGAEGEGGNIRHLFIVVISQSRLVQNLATIKYNINGMAIFFQCCGSGMFILDLNFSIPDPGSKRFRIPDPDPHQRILK